MKRLLLAFGTGIVFCVPCFSSPSETEFFSNEFYQTTLITGKVTDNNGQPLSGVTVMAKGIDPAVTTNNEGAFTINVPASVTVLVFSYVGMETQEVSIAGRTDIQVQMRTNEEVLGDVVVVGYGTQRRVNLSGSVSTVTGTTLTQRPAPNATALMQGRVTGLQVTQNSAEPGKDGGSLLIRGRGSFGGGTNNAPLILIDGVAGSMNNLNPDDIESVSVLKDAASASIYGARAANGVILVTTKKGVRGKTVISYRINAARHTATALPDLVTNSAEYMEMFNRAAPNSNGVTFRYAQTEIDKYKNATDLNQFPNFDYLDYYVNPATVINHSLSLSGGSEKNMFNFSVGHLDQEALLPGYKFRRYNALLNYSNQVSKSITLGTQINFTHKIRREPPFTGENMMLAIYAAGPNYGPFLPDGSGRIVSRAYSGEGRNRNPAEMYEMGWQNTKEYNINAQVSLDVRLMKGLTWSSKAAVNYVDEYYKMYQHNYSSFVLQEKTPAGDYVPFSFGPDILGVTDQYAKTILPTIYTTFTYDTRFGNDHALKGLVGYEQLSFRTQSLRARRSVTVSQSLTDLYGYSATGELLYNNSPRLPSLIAPSEWALQSVFGRVNYDFKGKYFFEGNIRYDGTSKVSPDYRWGLFPSASAAWLISREDFMAEKFDWLSNLKLRASWGKLGNQDVGTYLYQDNLSINVLYPFGNTTPVQGAVVNTFRDQSLRWETTEIFDIGLDMEIKRGLFGLSFDWFRKTTSGVLATQPIPASLGLGAPTTNDGKMLNKGIEVELRHRNSIGKFNYNAYFLLTTVRNELLSIRTPNTGGANIRVVGQPYNAHYLYVFDGIVQTGETPLPHSQTPTGLKPGDIKMRDVSGPDGKPDGRITPDDRIVVDGAYPDFSYSFGFNFDYKNFGLDLFFQGVEGLKMRLVNWGVDPFQQGTAPTTEWRNAWSPTNPSNTMPALYISGYPHMAQYNGSTFYLRDASYLRLKNVVLSYRFPKAIFSKIKASDLSIYISADNLVTFTKFKEADPERPNISSTETAGIPTSNFSQYPQTRILNLGLNIKF